MGAWPDKSRTCAREAAVDQGTWQNFVLLKHLTFLHTYTRECRGCLKALWTHYHSVHLGLPLSPDLSFRCGRYRCSLHLSSWQAAAAAGAGVGRQGVTVSGMASRLPATATTEACQALAGRSAGSTRLLNIGGVGGLGITCQPPPLPRKHSASKSCSNSIRLTRHQRKRMVAELNPFRCSNSHHWCDAFNHLHHPRAGYSRASATWASACVLSPPSPGHSRWGPWTGGHTALKELLHFLY